MAPAFLICSGVSVSGPIARLCLALAPETDQVKHVEEKDKPPNDAHKVAFENMPSLTASPCPSFRIYLCKLSSQERPAPFWHVKSTDVLEDANMELTKVAVNVQVSAAMRGGFKKEGAGTMLESYVCPEVEVTVILPVYVNNRAIEIGEKLCFYKEAEEIEQKKRKAPEAVDSLRVWNKHLAAESAQKEGRKRFKRH